MNPRKTVLAAVALATVLSLAEPAAARRFPSIVLVTVDTLRLDYLGAYGYPRNTSPHIDRLLAESVRFDQARTVEPLTNPAMTSMLTSLYPHEHGATRNGLRLRPGLPSLGSVLQQRGFATAAFVGNWTLKDELSGLSAHFEDYEEVFSRKRWLFMKSEATAEDLVAGATGWLEETVAADPDRPFLLWIHFVEPHEPYRRQESVLSQLGYSQKARLGPEKRYESEIAYVDRAIGHLLERLDRISPREDTIVVFAADHGENLGDHSYWGHGRHLWEAQLRVPLGIRWPGHLEPGRIEAPASLLDVAPTLLALIGHPVPEAFHGFDWTPVIRGESPPPAARTLYFQAHKGAVQPVEDGRRARQRGLLEVGMLRDGVKEVLRLERKELLRFALADDPAETRDLAPGGTPPTAELVAWLQHVEKGLKSADALPPPNVDAETAERMKALGYLD